VRRPSPGRLRENKGFHVPNPKHLAYTPTFHDREFSIYS
jgi:hypothetical protein